MNSNKVAVILVNYKDYAEKYLSDCYQGLRNQTLKEFDLFIVDNDSSPSSTDTIKKIAPSAQIIRNKENLGWAGGNNSAVQSNLKKYDYFVLLNMDTVLNKDWLEKLLKYIENNNVQIAQSKILIEGTDKINSLGNRINFLGYGFCNCYGTKESTKIESNKLKTDYASGASMIVRREVFEKIGLFREEFFMYHDDLEFCWRARLAGFKVGVAEDSIVYHKYSFGSTMNLIYYMERNRLLTLFSLEKLGSLLITLPILIPFEFMMLIYFAEKGRFTQKLRSIFYVFTPTGIKLIHTIRKEVSHYRLVADKEIVKNFSGPILFEEIKNPLLNNLLNPILNLYWKIFNSLIFW